MQAKKPVSAAMRRKPFPLKPEHLELLSAVEAALTGKIKRVDVFAPFAGRERLCIVYRQVDKVVRVDIRDKKKE